PAGRVEFWLRELRTPQLIVEAAGRRRDAATRLSGERALLRAALAGDLDAVERELAGEVERERTADREYWAPLRRELAELRRQRGVS
ncbi:MAG TPA: hypothetical protein VNL18_12435, partial [Gemmatimonadales bacterium]|nr:hypothetical protein [Gemmatimonadales bacterium]